MKYLRATVRADRDRSPTLFRLLAHSPHVEEARILEQHTAADDFETYLVAVEGDTPAFVETLRDHDAIESVDATHESDGTAYVLLVLRPVDDPVLGKPRAAVGTRGWILQLPIVYRDGTMHARAIGDPVRFQAMLDAGPDDIRIDIEEIGEFRGGIDDAWTHLSARQREALDHAARLGYYEQPRQATHEDVAAALGCAPQTASDHLQKAEAKVIQAALDEFGPLG